MHLVRRFFGFLTAKPLTPKEQHHVQRLLPPPLARAYFAQRYEDQRHAFDVEQRIGSETCAQAALLHDIGKTDPDLGAISRSLATIWNGIGLPTTGRWQGYLSHGPTGADMLAEIGANQLAVAFARHHPGPPPGGIDAVAWRSLEQADNT